ncbi:MAG: hypothetical protein ACREQI_12505 [Candidatus Binataceae bacterium]
MDRLTQAKIQQLEEQMRRIQPLLAEKRRPLFIEFAGTPKSGKTTTLSAIHQFLKRSGVTVRTFQERASVAPLLDKGTAFFNIWVTGATLNGMIEALEEEKLDVLILDRGLFDGLVWIDWQEKIHRLSSSEANTFRSFILTPRWRDLVDVVLVMHCSPSASLEREHAKQITLRRGSIMNMTTLAQLRNHYLDAARRYRKEFKVIKVLDSTRGQEMSLITEVGQFVLRELENFADEEVLCLPRRAVEEQLTISDGELLTPDWPKFKRLVNKKGAYVIRSRAEDSDSLLQVVPVCVIRYGNKYLTNVRHEPGESLDKALGNWAGGHVRRQDLDRAGSKWESVSAGLRREIHEELSLEDLPEPKLIGIVHTSEDARAARHLGVVFQAKFLEPSTVAVLQNKTIRERPNRYVRTKWMNKADLSRTMKEQKDWSRAISNFLIEPRAS